MSRGLTEATIEYWKDKPRKTRRPLVTRQPKSYKAFLAGPNKYGAYSATYNGYTYDSRMEARYAAQLDQLKMAQKPEERVVSFERQVKVPLDVNGKHIANYYCDFLVHFQDGHDEWHETKGFVTDVFKIKEKLFRALYPERIFKVIY